MPMTDKKLGNSIVGVTNMIPNVLETILLLRSNLVMKLDEFDVLITLI